MKGARLGDCAHPLIVELLGNDGDHTGSTHAIETGGMGTARRGHGVFDDGNPKTFVEQAECGLRHADIGFEADEHGCASPGLADGRPDEWVVGEAEDDLAEHGGIANGTDELGVEATPVVRRLDRGDHRNLAVARALDEKGDAFEQTGLGRVFDARQKVGLDVDHDEDRVGGIDQEAHVWMLAVTQWWR